MGEQPEIGVIVPRTADAEGIVGLILQAGLPDPQVEEYETLDLDAPLVLLKADPFHLDRTATVFQSLKGKPGRRIIVLLYSEEKDAMERILDLQPDGILIEPRSAVALYAECLRVNQSPRETTPKDMLELAPVGIFQTTSDGRPLYVNQRMAEMLGLSNPDEALAYYHDLAEQLYVDSQRRVEFVKQLRLTGRVDTFEYQARKVDGSFIWVEMTARINRYLQPDRFLIDGYAVDISGRKLSEEKLREREARYRRVVEASPNAILTVDRRGRVQGANGAAERLLGSSQKRLLGTHYATLLEPGEHVEGIDRMFQAVLGGGSFSGVDLSFRRNNGEQRYTLSRIYPSYGPEGVVDGAVFANTDITDRRLVELQLREREEHLQNLNKEKETLLLEIHHRVKNNLQAIVSLINLQQGYVHDRRDGELFLRSAERVRSMALVHEQLYQSSSYAEIEFGEYLESLLREISSAHADDRRISFHLEQEPVLLDLHRAVPAGLVVNELVSNAVKHAPPPPAAIEVRVALRRRENRVEIEVSNTGASLPEDFDLSRPRGLGLTLVQTLSQQLQGELEVSQDDIVRFTLSFPR